MAKKSKKKLKISKRVKSNKDFPTLQLKKEADIAMDFATKVYKKFDKMIKSVILFGSAGKNLKN